MVGFKSNTIQCHIARYNSQNSIYEFLLLKRSANLQVYPYIWQVITGTAENKETALECTFREVLEETSLNLQKYDIYNIPCVASFFLPVSNCISFSPVFGVIVNEAEEIIISPEHQDFKWLASEEALNELLLPSHKEAHKIFNDYIINSKDKDLFKIKIK